MSLVLSLLCAATGPWITGCAASKRGGSAGQGLRAPGESGGASDRSATQLVADAQAQLDQGAFAEAARLYRQALLANPAQQEQVAALDGLAQARRAQGDCVGANRALLTLFDLDGLEQSKEELQTRLYQRGICYAELVDWEKSASDLEQALEVDHDPGLARRMELHARAGLALFHVDRLDEASRVFQAGIDLYGALDSEVRERLADPYFLAMSHFYLGAVAHRRFSQITLNLPEQRMARELEQKVKLIEELQTHYHNAIRVRHVFWVSAAGFQLGSAFETFYDEMMQSPVPPRLSAPQRAIFYTQLKSKIRPVLLRAVDVYEKNLAAAKRLGYSTPFVEDTKARLAQLQHYLVSEMSTGPFAPPPLAVLDAAQETGPKGMETPFRPEPTPL